MFDKHIRSSINKFKSTELDTTKKLNIKKHACCQVLTYEQKGGKHVIHKELVN